MRLLTIGIDRPGTTSHHRRLTLEGLLTDAEPFHIDTAIPFDACARLFRSLAFRTCRGPAVRAVNRSIQAQLKQMPESFDLIWVDKAVFLDEETIGFLRARTDCLVHYTPDCAFHANRSRHFERCGSRFDLLITTKSFEEDLYRRYFPGTALQFVTQGYQAEIHRPAGSFEDKADVVAFVGLAEPDRFEAIEALLAARIPVKLAGRGWDRFTRKHESDPAFSFAGPFLAGTDYVDFLSSALFGLGLVSKRFPERHTTRTFEIPACGTALITEKNTETQRFFEPEEAIFFESREDMIDRIQALRGDLTLLQSLTEKGRRRVERDGRSYQAILSQVLQSLGFS